MAMAGDLLPAEAQSPPPHIRRFTTASGLAHNRVNSVVQDRFGFLWVATRRGLQRFDGTTFIEWPDAETRDPRLRDDLRIRALDDDDRLWLATPDELFHVHLGTGEVAAFPGFLEAVAIDRTPEGGVWLARSGELHRVPREGLVASDTLLDVIPEGAEPVWMDHGPSGLWIAGRWHGENRVVLHEPATGATRDFVVAGAGQIRRVMEDPRGWVWVGGDRGLTVLLPEAAGPDARTEQERQALESLLRESGLDRADVDHFFLSRGGDVWVAAGDWLTRLRPDDGTAERYGSAEGAVRPFSMPYVDARGIVWVGSLAGGLHRLDPRPRRFVHLGRGADLDPGLDEDFVVSLLEGEDGALWIGTLGAGLYRMEGLAPPAVRVALPAPPASTDPAQDQVWAIHRDARGRLWVGTNAGLCRLDDPGGGWCVRSGNSPSEVTAIIDAPGGALWVAVYRRGVFLFDPKERSFGPAAAWTNVSSVAVDHAGTLWAGSGSAGIGRVAGGGPEEGGREIATLSARGVDASRPHAGHALHVDEDGVLWMGTDSGLERLAPDGGSREVVALSGTPPTSVFSIVADAAGALWLGTAHGLIRYDPHRGSARRFGPLDGVGGTEFNRGAAVRLRSGELLFGGVDGLTLVHPERAGRTDPPAPVALTSWGIVGRGGARGGPLRDTDEIRLAPDDNAVTLEFAVLDYEDPLGHRFRYRMEGADPEWLLAWRGERRVTYAALGPGSYTFRLRAFGAEEEALPSEARIRIIVEPALSEMAWFHLALLGLAGGGLYLAYRLRLERHLETVRFRLRVARDLHDEVGAGLSAIALMSDAAVRSEGLDAGTRSGLERIGASARKMVGQVRDIAWAIGPEADRAGEFGTRMQDAAAELLPGVRVAFDFDRESAPAPLEMAARRDLLLAYKEALHNVARHSAASTVSVRLVRRGRQLELTVTDDGRGFDPDAVRIGTGLKSLAERAARLGGTLEILSASGEGTKIRLTAPLRGGRRQMT